MAIKSFKDIIKNKAYLISQDDRKIFEDGTLQSFFGLGAQDAIEFILYDSSDNQLPQSNGELVRYIAMNTTNIGNYVLIPEGTLLKRYQFPVEYFIDVELLIKEAGYTTGIFKTQVTLLNKRVGNEEKYNKLWITEISPSKTEIRVEPLKKGMELNAELFTRFKLFTDNGDFRDDTIYFISNFLDKITPTSIGQLIKQKYGNTYFNKFIVEYNIHDFDTFINTVHTTFKQSAIYEFSNNYSTITDINYGKPKQTPIDIKLSKSDIVEICKNLLIRSIDYYLTKPIYTTNTTFDIKNDGSNDVITKVRQYLE